MAVDDNYATKIHVKNHGSAVCPQCLDVQVSNEWKRQVHLALDIISLKRLLTARVRLCCSIYETGKTYK